MPELTAIHFGLMALMLVVSGGLFGPDFFLYVAVAQIPIYLLPLLAERIYPRLP